MYRESFTPEQITGIIQAHCDPDFNGEYEILPSKRGSAALAATRLGKFIVKYADHSNIETEQKIAPSRSAGIYNEISFLRLIPEDLSPGILAGERTKDATYSIIPYLEGETLSKVAETKQNRRARLIKPLIEAVHRLHEIDVIHGDLTIENALVRDDNIKLLDFELSHDLNINGAAPGLYHYLSPEASTAIVNKQTPRLDAKEETFALAVCCLATLTGQQPTRYASGGVSRSKSLEDKAAGLITYNLEGVRESDHDMARAVEDILLAPSNQRPSSPMELYEAIESYT